MATTPSLSLLLFLLSLLTPTSVHPKPLQDSPYLSPATVLFPDYDRMLATFKIYVYPPPTPFTFATPSESLFHASLLNSRFITDNPDEAHLFYVPFPPDLPSRSLSGLVRSLRTNFTFWYRSLGADHFFLSCAGIGHAPDRNVLELKKNSVQISCFPTTSGDFFPHKDVILPPVPPSPLALPHAPVGKETATFLGFMKRDEEQESQSSLVEEVEGDPEFLVESEPSDLTKSKFCLFVYGGDGSWLGEALRLGCVPVMITDRPIQDMPLIDVVRWSEIAVFVGSRGGVAELKRVLGGIGGEQYERMRGLGVTVGRHFVWNKVPQPFDAFHMVMYQLWLRRHTIRYVRREWM
ncbi:hypothetical protein RHSIM_Rhsim09G0169100 [Rhododendron simsii]|uniref:Exostosin GT47 domain-containing protein n=1 Tax=Rhododendron simsii TaxID=118357 RepID=A0A834LF76_RHOSS|nr:hypothetical protein RHSIM_Rhsim09G0169100 [Rhododendron simsii]